MINTMNQAQAQTPSGFVLPMSATAFGGGVGMAGGAKDWSAPMSVVRDRHVAGTALAQAPRPGSTAWSPPIC